MQGHPDIKQSKYVQSRKIFSNIKNIYLSRSLCLLATERFSLGLLAHVHSGHVGGFPSDGETVMNLVPLSKYEHG